MHKRIRYGEISNHKPRKGTETIQQERTDKRLPERFQTTNPARGRKQDIQRKEYADGERRFQTTNPARGRKRISRTAYTPLYTNFKPQTPQGDGNFQLLDEARQFDRLDFKPQTPQGDGNSPSPQQNVNAQILFQTTNPARGRKPVVPIMLRHLSKGYFKPQTPQGDGNTTFAVIFNRRNERFQTTNPARGRKLPPTSSTTGFGTNFKPQTPQGDGNLPSLSVISIPSSRFQTTNPARGRKLFYRDLHCFSFQAISNHKPRKGTETPPPAAHVRGSSPRNFKPQTPQGDGNDMITSYVGGDLPISNHKLRKGTETRRTRTAFHRP